jgi:hypothetical protein
MNHLTTTAVATLIVAAIPLTSPLAATPGFGDVPPQKIVISLQSDPLKIQEPACVALQLGTAILKSRSPEGDIDDEVTIFATLDGVGIANVEVMASPQLMNAPSKFCKTVNQLGELQDPVPLPQVLQNYLVAGGKILACPLCWVIKFGDLAQSMGDLITYDGQVYIDSPVPLFLYADKVIDY